MPRASGHIKITGLSKSIISHSFRGCQRQSRILTAGKQRQRKDAADALRQAKIREMSAEDQDVVESMIADHGMDVETLPYTAPPGDEGFGLSHGGCEHEAFEGLAHGTHGRSSDNSDATSADKLSDVVAPSLSAEEEIAPVKRRPSLPASRMRAS
ncbi:hypothetical protein F4604DRAFT_1921217 [Suillus subluteus]|nr:hypothetical protein F4604DRAFT_1921217 [Suillus subluteus]